MSSKKAPGAVSGFQTTGGLLLLSANDKMVRQIGFDVRKERSLILVMKLRRSSKGLCVCKMFRKTVLRIYQMDDPLMICPVGISLDRGVYLHTLNLSEQISQKQGSPVDTQRRFNVYKSYRRLIDVGTTSCVYWVSAIYY